MVSQTATSQLVDLPKIMYSVNTPAFSSRREMLYAAASAGFTHLHPSGLRLRESPMSDKPRPAISLDYRAIEPAAPDSGEVLAKAAKTVHIAPRREVITVETMPSVHAMLHNAYSVIDVELRRLGREAQMAGLSKTETTQFERYAAAMVKLVGLEHDIRDNSELDAMSDEALTDAVVTRLEGVLPTKEEK